MKEEFKRYALKIIAYSIVIILIIGLINSILNPKEPQNIKDNIVSDNAIPEIYDEEQMAFINYDEVYKYFMTIADAEDCKDKIIAKIKSEKVEEKVWIVNDVVYNSNNLMFYVSSNNIRYTININKYQTIIKRG